MNFRDSKESLHEKGLKEYNEGNLSSAIKYYRESIEIAAKDPPVNQSFVFKTSIEIAQVYIESSQPQEALPYTDQAYSILQSDTSGVISFDESADYMTVLGNLTFYLEHFDKAFVCYGHAEFLYNDINDKNLAKAKKSRAQSRQGEIAVAIRELQSVLTLDSLNIETKNKVRKYLTDIMVETGQYQDALRSYQSILDELKQKYEISTLWLLETLYNMATANFELGNYGIALNQYKQVLSEIALHKIPGSYRLNIQTLLMISRISIIIRDTSEAIRLLDSVDEQSLLETDRKFYQLVRAQLELHNLNTGQEGSNKYLDLIINYQIGKKLEDTDADILTLQSNIHFQYGDIRLAIINLRKLIKYYQNSGNSYQVSVYKLHLCQVLLNSGLDYQNSEILFHINDIEALINHEPVELFTIKSQVKIAQLYYRIEEYDQSYKTLEQIYQHEWEIIRGYVLSGDKEQVFFQDIIDLLLNITLATSKQLIHKRNELHGLYLSLHIKLKSLFQVNSEIFSRLISMPDLQERNLILRYNQKRKELNSWMFSKREDYHQLKMEVNYLENKIKNDTDYFGTIKNIINNRWEDLKHQLDTNEAAITLARYECLNEAKTDRSAYLCFIIFNDSTHPECIDLKISDSFLLEMLPFNRVRNFEPEGLFELDVELPLLGDLSRLYESIFKPLEMTLKNTQRIYFTVDGLLNYVPFCALLVKRDKYLLDTFELIQLQNLRDKKAQKAKISIDSIAIFGGIDFGRFNEEKDGRITEDNKTVSALKQIPEANN